LETGAGRGFWIMQGVARAKFALMKLSNDAKESIPGELVEKYRVEALKRGYPVW
jgi:hypothetical protein